MLVDIVSVKHGLLWIIMDILWITLYDTFMNGILTGTSTFEVDSESNIATIPTDKFTLIPYAITSKIKRSNTCVCLVPYHSSAISKKHDYNIKYIDITKTKIWARPT